MKYRGHKTLPQSHTQLAEAYEKMTRAIWRKSSGGRMSDEDKAKYYGLEEQANEHRRKSQLFGDTFIMIL